MALDRIRSIAARVAKEIREGTFDLNTARQVFTAVPAGSDAKTIAALKQNVDILTGATGSVLDKAVTLRDLVDEGVLTVQSGGFTAGSGTPGTLIPAGGAGGGGGDTTIITDPSLPTLSTAPTPTALQAYGMVRAVFLEWKLPLYANHGGTEVWRHTADSIGSATKIAEVDSTVFTDTTAVYGVTYYYWVRAFLANGDRGAYNAVAGASTTTTRVGNTDLAPLIVEAGNLATGAVTSGKIAANAIAVGTAAIQNGAIVNAMIADAAINNAKIANLSADKITSGFIDAARIQAGSLDAKIANLDAAVITSGFVNMARIADASITAAKIQDASITNAKIGAVIQSSTYTAGSVGWQLDKSGSIKAYFGSGANQFDLTATGTTPVLKIGSVLNIRGDGSATYAGALSAATGTFAGSLSAATGTFAGSLSAATGTFSGTLTADAVDAVDSLNIRGDAVVVPRRGYGFVNGQYGNSGAFGLFSIPEIAFPASGRVVIFVRAAFWKHEPNTGDAGGGLAVYANGAQIWSSGLVTFGDDPFARRDISMFSIEHFPTTGSWAYSAAFTGSGGRATTRCEIEVTVFAVKR